MEALLGPLTDDRIAVLINLSKKISDFSIEEENKPEGDGDIYENEGVNVQFDSDEEEDDGGMVNEIKGDSEEESEEEEGVDTDYTATLKGDGHLTEDEQKARGILHPRDIDAHWIQRSLAKYFKDPLIAQQKQTEVIGILKNAADDRDAENQLVLLLGFDQFEFIKCLRQNRLMILYCTLLRQANEKERLQIEDDMRSRPELHPILALLQETDEGSVVQVEKSKRDAEKSKKAATAANEAISAGQWQAGRKMLDLNDLTFSQGSHLMSNKR